MSFRRLHSKIAKFKTNKIKKFKYLITLKDSKAYRCILSILLVMKT